MSALEVLAPGLLTTVQDGGRHGYATLGVGSAGAMDPVCMRLANMLVGNTDHAALLEITLRGPRLRVREDLLIAITGAELEVRCGGFDVPVWRPVLLRAGCELDCGGVRRGARSYLAVAGGIAVRAVLGSRSSDVNAALGTAPLASGDVLPVGKARTRTLRELSRATTRAFAAAAWQLDPKPWFDAAGAHPVRVLSGTHFPQMDNAAQRALFGSGFRIGNASNRVGYRLEGTLLSLREPLELISEGVLPGTVQLPPGGEPIVLMAEAPTTGGYPRIAQVISADLPRLAQRRPGDIVRFAETSLDTAQAGYLQREQALQQLRRSVAERLRG
jgi:biotin-dependent carboxylase-like uncharacterized protein